MVCFYLALDCCRALDQSKLATQWWSPQALCCPLHPGHDGQEEQDGQQETGDWASLGLAATWEEEEVPKRRSARPTSPCRYPPLSPHQQHLPCLFPPPPPPSAVCLLPSMYLPAMDGAWSRHSEGPSVTGLLAGIRGRPRRPRQQQQWLAL